MYHHTPSGYVCPFCLVVAGIENEHVWTMQGDVVLRDKLVTAFVAAGWWPNNVGHVIIVPNAHHENIFDLPIEYATAIHAAAQRIAVAFKQAYYCPGVSTRQHNEPVGNQDVWHYQLHIFPRYPNHRLYELINERRRTTPEERLPYAERLRRVL
jgi:histidine triad (HIT) family protein